MRCAPLFPQHVRGFPPLRLHTHTQAYQQAKAGGGAAGTAASKAVTTSRMPISQARQVLDLEASAKAGTLTREMVRPACTKWQQLHF
jgi:hypothetical protein